MPMSKEQLQQLVQEKTQRIDDIIDTLKAVKGERYAKAAAMCADTINAGKLILMSSTATEVAPMFTHHVLALGAFAAEVPDDAVKFNDFCKDVMTFCTASFVPLPDVPTPDSLGG